MGATDPGAITRALGWARDGLVALAITLADDPATIVGIGAACAELDRNAIALAHRRTVVKGKARATGE